MHFSRMRTARSLTVSCSIRRGVGGLLTAAPKLRLRAVSIHFDHARTLILPSPHRNALRPQRTLFKYNALNLLVVIREALVSINNGNNL